MNVPARLLWVDCTAGLIAGVTVLSLAGWFSNLYALPRPLMVGIALANICYGLYSFSLARRSRRPRCLVVGLVVANATWAVLCVVAGIALAPTASPFGLAHLFGEALFVGCLAALEWRQRVSA